MLIQKEILHYENYLIDNNGNVWSKLSKKYLKQRIHKGYKMINFNDHTTKLVHRLVAEAFISNTENKSQVNHKDGNKCNNNVNNLEWVTPKENIQHAIQNGLAGSIGETNHNSKLTEKQAKEIKQLTKIGILNNKEIAKKYNITHQTVSCIKLNKSWKHLP